MKYSKTDQQILEIALAATALAAIAIGVVTSISAFIQDELETTVELASTAQLGSSGDYSLLTRESTVAITDPSASDRALAALPTVLATATVAIVALLILRVVRTLRVGDPFNRDNARFLMLAAGVALVGGLLAAAGSALCQLVLSSRVPSELDVEAAGFMTFTPVFAAMGLAVVAEIFRRGTQIRAELDGVI